MKDANMSAIFKFFTVFIAVLCVIFLFLKSNITCKNKIENEASAIAFSINHWNKLIDSGNLYINNNGSLKIIVKSKDFNNINSSLRTQEKLEKLFNIIWTIIYKTKYNDTKYEIITQFDKCGTQTDETQILTWK